MVRAVLAAHVCLVVALTLLGPLAPAASAAPDPIGCTGYPQPRVALESQSWWRGTPAGDRTIRHVHSGVCFPYKQTLDGRVTFDVVTMLHNYPGWMLRFVRVQVASDQDDSDTLGRAEPRLTCHGVDCTFVTPVTVDLSDLAAGIWEFRVHSEVRPDATASRPWSLATNGWLACVRSCAGGRTPKAVDAWETEGRGYYKTTDDSIKGYVNGRFLDDLPWNPASGQLEPKRGTWCPNVRTLKGAGDEPVTDSFITVDPRFHAVPEDRGRVLLEQEGTFEGPICIDTTTLADGRHKLFIQSSWDGGEEQLWGSIVIPFLTDNGLSASPWPPSPGAVTPTPLRAPRRTARRRRVDRRAPALAVRVPGPQRVGRRRGAVAYARCSERCTVRVAARLLIGSRSYRLRRARETGAAGRRLRIKARLTRRSARVLRTALLRGRRVRVRVAVRARDRAGNRSRAVRRTVRVRR